MNVGTVMSCCEWVYRQPCICQRKKGDLSSLFVLILLRLDVLSMCVFSKKDFQSFGLVEDAGHALPCPQPQVWRARRWVLLRWNVFGLKYTVKVNSPFTSS